MPTSEEEKRFIRERGWVRELSTDRYCDILFTVPVPVDSIKGIETTESPAHIGNLSNAIDFVTDLGTELSSPHYGRVDNIKDDSDKGGDDPKYWFDGNFIRIRHRSDLFSYFEHLMYRGVRVKVGQTVQEGELLGYTGNTGYTDEPHVHCEFQEPYGLGENGYVTLRPRFRNFPDVFAGESFEEFRKALESR